MRSSRGQAEVKPRSSRGQAKVKPALNEADSGGYQLPSYLADQRRVSLGSWDGIHGFHTALQGPLTGFRISLASLVTATCM